MSLSPSPSKKQLTQAKIVMLGGCGVGKSAFVVRYITKRYIGDYENNKEMVYTHKVNSPRGDDITLEIVDTASQTSSADLENHIKSGDGFVMMYSVTDRNSFCTICRLKETLYQHKPVEIPLVLVANKSDILTARSVTEDEGTALAADLDCPKYEISVADSPQGVLESMDELLRQILREHVKSLTRLPVHQAESNKKSKLLNMKNALKKRIGRSRSDTF
ncbi:LOW QUALITY PROTEIN: ras-related and estrogen-regulated growth inhibitor-like [Liolophura sinensis]|uniref:LOW QUALITY PROTEIN: ras-related and estrogen-regulated growth inhibitor-like n=1 Tax=Liolophura sinensis TaxID=3198878 RepID=UPI0031582438